LFVFFKLNIYVAISLFQNKINANKDEQIDLIKSNTTRINELVDIMSETKKLERALDAKQRNLVNNYLKN
jgi:hypothetical protein